MPTSRTRTPVDLAATALRLAGHSTLWQSLVSYDPTARYYTRLASEPTYEAWLLTWLPGQGTDWHDHGGSAGAFVTLRGTLTEEQAAVSPFSPPRVLAQRRQLADGALRTFGAKHLHRVTNAGTEPAVSLHVYAPALAEMNTYTAQGKELVLVESQLVGVDW
ncbi:MAG: cysteine dioxygenase [Actinomycetes bacterium]